MQVQTYATASQLLLMIPHIIAMHLQACTTSQLLRAAHLHGILGIASLRVERATRTSEAAELGDNIFYTHHSCAHSLHVRVVISDKYTAACVGKP